jgi:hypothetical protein
MSQMSSPANSGKLERLPRNGRDVPVRQQFNAQVRLCKVASVEIGPRAAFTAMPESVKITDGCGSHREFPLPINGAENSRTLSYVVDNPTTIGGPAWT